MRPGSRRCATSLGLCAPVRGDLIDQSPVERGGGVDLLPGQGEICGPPTTDTAGDTDCATRPGDQPHREFWQSNSCVLVGENSRREAGQLDAGADAVAM